MKIYAEQRQLGEVVDSDCVLIIDDDKELATELGDFVESLGLEAVLVHDGITGLSVVSELLPKVALIDVQMPGMNGIDVVKEVRGKHPEVGLVLMSGADKGELEKMCGDDKDIMVLAKPLPLNDLGKFLRMTFGKSIWSAF
jgi:two-component system response regulator CpxR